MIYLGQPAQPRRLLGRRRPAQAGQWARDHEVGDIDGDGAPDIAAANDGVNVIWGEPSHVADADPVRGAALISPTRARAATTSGRGRPSVI